MSGCCPVNVLVVAKAPVPGYAKTRLAAAIGNERAAEFAAASLADTLDAVAGTPVVARTVALTGDLERASGAAELRSRLADFTVIAQRGDGFAERLAHAHHDAGALGYPVLQIGMDTPQVSAQLLAECADALLGTQAVLGPAADGGWWALGLQDVSVADCLRSVPMSRADTGAETLRALRDVGVDVQLLPTLADVDTVEDVDRVCRECAPDSRFRSAALALEV